MNQVAGIILRCDVHGNITEILRNPPGMEIHAEVGMPFARLAALGSMAKALSFLVEVREQGVIFDWEINVNAGKSAKSLRFVGASFSDSILIAGSDAQGDTRVLYEELIRMHSEQTAQLRAALKQSANESHLYEEISRLNNELVNLQRQLAKQNAELERLYAEAQRSAVLDSLTDVYNRRGLFELGEEEVQRASRYQRPLSLIMFDVDHFKILNDTHGHMIADVVLQQLTARCRRVLRQVDIFSRYGGEEFVILLPETRLDAATALAERLRAAAEEPISTGGALLAVTISLGVASLREDHPELEDLLRQADVALYQAKEAGRNCVRIASE